MTPLYRDGHADADDAEVCGMRIDAHMGICGCDSEDKILYAHSRQKKQGQK